MSGTFFSIGKFLLFLVSMLLITSCTPYGKDFSTKACVRENLNCNSPSTIINLVGGDQNQDSISITKSEAVMPSVQIKKIRYGESAIIEFLITNPKFNPLMGFKMSLDPADEAFHKVSGVSAKSCAGTVLLYKQTCSAALRFEPAMIPPDAVEVTFAFNTITNEKFKFKTQFDPAVLVADFYINADDLEFPDTLVFAEGVASDVAKEIKIINTGSKPGEDLTISNVELEGESCSLVSSSGISCEKDVILKARDATSSCYSKVLFKPLTSGLKSCQLKIFATNGTSRNYTITGRGVGLVSDVKTIDFGMLKTSSASVTHSDVSLSLQSDSLSTQASTCSASISPSDSPFSLVTEPISSSILIPSQSLKLKVSFTPQSKQKTHRAEVVYSCDNRGGKLKIPISAVSTEHIITSDLSVLDFSNVMIGTSQTKKVLIKNVSNFQSVSQIIQSVSSSLGVGYTVKASSTVPSCGASLAAGTSCYLDVTFSPKKVGVLINELRVIGGEDSLTPALALNGKGVGIAASVENLDFGVIRPHKDLPGGAILISNEGDVAAEGCIISSVGLTEKGFSLDSHSSCLGKSNLGAGQSCTIYPRFTAGETEGEFEAQLSMNCSVGGKIEIPLAAKVKANLKLVPVPPSELSFKKRLVGVTDDKEFIFSNLESSISGGENDLSNLNVESSSVSLPWSLLSGQSQDCKSLSALPAQSNCKLRLRYHPIQAGDTSGQITVKGDNTETFKVSFSATAAQIEASRSELDFGVVSSETLINADERIYISNPSNVDNATLCSFSNLSHFQIVENSCSDSIDRDQQCSFLVQVLPSTQGQIFDETLKYSCGVGGEVSISLKAVVKKKAVLSWTSAPVVDPFGRVDVGQNQDVLYTLKHEGALEDAPARNLLIDVNYNSMATYFSVIQNNCHTILGAQETCTVYARYSPLSGGMHTAKLVANSVATSSFVDLSGIAINASDRISLPKETLDFGDPLVGSFHTQSMTITNLTAFDSGVITMGDITSPWSRGSACNNVSLASMEPCTFDVTLAPSLTDLGKISESLPVAATNASKLISLQATVKKVGGILAVFDFGDLPITSAGSHFTSSKIAFLNPSASDDASTCSVSVDSPFTVNNETCQSSGIDKKSYCFVNLNLPTSASAVSYSAKKLKVSCQVGGEVTINLNAHIKDMPFVVISGESFFGEWDEGVEPLVKSFTIFNQGGTDVNLNNLKIAGSNDFSVLSSTCGAQLGHAPGVNECVVEVQFTPSQAGAINSILSLDVADALGRTGAISANLMGIGSTMDLQVTPLVLNFDPIKFGSSQTQKKTVSILNNGSRKANLSYSDISNSVPLSRSGDCGSLLLPGDSCSMEFSMSAAAWLGDHAETFRIQESLSSKITTTEIAISGHTWESPLLSISDDRGNALTTTHISTTDITGPVDSEFNIVNLSPGSRSAVITIKNNRPYAFPLQDITVNSANLSGAGNHISFDASNCAGKTLGRMETCVVNATYSPLSIREVQSRSSLSIGAKDDGVALSSVSVDEVLGNSYKGVDLVVLRSDGVSHYPASVDLGWITASQSSVSETMKIVNQGDVTAKGLNFVFSGYSFSRYSMINNSCASNLIGGASCQAEIKFLPNGDVLAQNSNLQLSTTNSTPLQITSVLGASYFDNQGSQTPDATSQWVEPEIASDENYFYITSKFQPLSVSSSKLSLQICSKSPVTGNIDLDSCNSSVFTTVEDFWAGPFGGYKLEPLITANKVVISTTVQGEGLNASADKSSILICDKSKINNRTLDFNMDCEKVYLHEISRVYNTDATIDPAGKGAFTSTKISNGKLVSSAQNVNGFSMTACTFNDTLSGVSALSNCKSYFKNVSGSGTAEYTDIYYDGSTIVMAAYRNGVGLHAIACNVDAENNFICGDYEPIDITAVMLGENQIYPGAHPFIAMQSGQVTIVSQQGSTKSQALRIAHCELQNLSFSCSTKNVASESGTNGLGLNPSMKVISRGASRIAWIQTVWFDNYSSPDNGSKTLAFYTCDLVDFSADCIGQPQFQDLSNYSDAPIFARSMDLDVDRLILTVPFTNQNYKTGVLTFGLKPEL